MNWLSFKKKGGASAGTEPQRPGSKGSVRDPTDVAVGVEAEGVEPAAEPEAENAGDEVQAWQTSPEHGDGNKPPRSVGEEEEEEEETKVKKSPLKGMNMSNEELAAKLFDSINKSGDGNICRDELLSALQVFLLMLMLLQRRSIVPNSVLRRMRS